MAQGGGLRVLYFINGFDPGGAEHGLLTLVKSGFFSGHRLRVLGMCRGRGTLADTIRAEPGPERVSIVDDREGLSLVAVLRSVPALIREIRDFRPDAVVLSLKQANIVGRFVLRFFPSVRCISFEHISRYRARRAERVYGGLLTALSGRVDEVWADCQETLDATRGYFSRRGRSEAVIPLFCADEKRAGKTDFSVGSPVRIVGAGRLVDRKNFDKVIRAVWRMNKEGQDTELTIFGDGPEMDRLGELIRELGLEDKVRLAGYRPSWFNEAFRQDIFVNASDTEGFCIVVAEAMSVGLPVIATNVGGIREYGRHDRNMLTLEGGNESDIVAAVRRLAADEALRKRLGDTARRDMLEGFSQKAVALRGDEVLSRAGRAG